MAKRNQNWSLHKPIRTTDIFMAVLICGKQLKTVSIKTLPIFTSFTS